MAAADENPGSTLAINNDGLFLFQDGAGRWLIRGSTDGLIHAARDRLVWLLPLLERSPADISAALPQVPMAKTPIPALVRFALTSWGEHWPALALGWLESGWPAGDLLDVLAEMRDSRKLPQSLRHRALRLWCVWVATAVVPLSNVSPRVDVVRSPARYVGSPATLLSHVP